MLTSNNLPGWRRWGLCASREDLVIPSVLWGYPGGGKGREKIKLVSQFSQFYRLCTWSLNSSADVEDFWECFFFLECVKNATKKGCPRVRTSLSQLFCDVGDNEDSQSVQFIKEKNKQTCSTCHSICHPTLNTVAPPCHHPPPPPRQFTLNTPPPHLPRTAYGSRHPFALWFFLFVFLKVLLYRQFIFCMGWSLFCLFVCCF